MGRESLHMQAHTSVSRHNSPEDLADVTAWNDFVSQVRLLAQAPEYDRLYIDIIGGGEYAHGMED